MPKRGERETEPALVDDFAAAERAEQPALEQLRFGPLAGLGDGRRLAARPLVIQQAFEHADGGMKRRAPAFGRFAVPAAIFELLAQELLCQGVVRFLEIGAEAENSAVDAGLRFAVQERSVVEPRKYQPPVDAVDHSARLLARRVQTEVSQDGKSVEGNQQFPVVLRQIGPPPAGTFAPVASRRLQTE